VEYFRQDLFLKHRKEKDMKRTRILTLLIVLILVLVSVIPASAQLGDTDRSSFTVQNVDTVQAEVWITFITSDGTQITPSVLNASKPNPFFLDPNDSWEIVVPQIPSSELPNGSYSVMISSSARVVAIANLKGTGAREFNGSYQSFSEGATDFYLPGVVYNYYGWFSLITVQNLGDADADVTVTITCNNVVLTGTLTRNNIPSMASHSFVLKTQTPTGFTTSTSCNGSALVHSDQPVVAADNQTIPADGNLQSYSGTSAGFQTLYLPALYYNYFGWNASLNIRRLNTGPDALVTINYSNGGSNTCTLTNAAPSCLKIMRIDHPVAGTFGAKITSPTGTELIAIANAKKDVQAQTYNGVGSGSSVVGIPAVYKNYYGWRSSFTCQNVGSVDTQIRVEYEGYAGNAYNHSNSLSAATNETQEIKQVDEPFLPASNWRGSVTITALTGGAQIACIQNYTNPQYIPIDPGDWSTSNNAFPR
jgi:hypothetical protein